MKKTSDFLKHSTVFITLNFCCLIYFTITPLTAQEDDQKFIANEIAAQTISDEIMSPYCPGRTLSACPSDDARKLRLQILTQLNQGYSVDAVKILLVGTYGKDIIGKPSYTGFGLVAWILPFVILLFCILLILGLIKKNNKRKKTREFVENDFNKIEDSLYSKIKK